MTKKNRLGILAGLFYGLPSLAATLRAVATRR
jgi:hypothetical protein